MITQSAMDKKKHAMVSYENMSEELVTQMIKDITEQIFNATVANW